MLVRRLLLFAIAFAHSALAGAQEAERPNIVVFLVDDLGWQDTSVPFHTERTPFNDHFRTPHLEQLAARGVLFPAAHAYAVCSPTRTSLMNGQNAARHRVTNWTLHADRDSSGKTKRLEAPEWRLEGLQPDPALLPALLQAGGYRTIHAGKAHWGARGTAGSDPCNLGFDVSIAGHAAGAPQSYQGTDDFGAKNAVWGVPGLEAWHGLPVHLTDVLTGEALRAVEDAVADEQPFFLYLAHYAVHTPIQPHEPYSSQYREAGVDETEARYAGMVEGVDASLGTVLKRLQQLGVAENTIVVYLSDNGGLSAHARGKTPAGTGANTHNAPLRAGKGSAYEGGTRIPQVVAWAQPDDDNELQKRFPIARGKRTPNPTLVEDLYPTVLHWAGLESPSGHIIDGRDWSPFLENADMIGPLRFLTFHYPHKWGPDGPGYEPHSALRSWNWKLIHFYEDDRWELYDLRVDPSEQNDLSAAQPEVLDQLQRQLARQLDRYDAQYPIER